MLRTSYTLNGRLIKEWKKFAERDRVAAKICPSSYCLWSTEGYLSRRSTYGKKKNYQAYATEKR